MSNFVKIQEHKREFKEKDKVRKEKLAGYFYDLSKLSFAGLVIGIILPLFTNVGDLKIWCVAILGLLLTILSALFRRICP